MGKNTQIDIPWTDIPIMLALGRNTSLSAAAQELGIDRTTVARRLERLESDLGTPLIERQHGEVLLTQQGHQVFSVAERAEQELSKLKPGNGERRFGYGKVRLSLSEQVLSGFAPYLLGFINSHPEAFLELNTSDRFLNLQRYESDIVIRITKSPPNDLYSRNLGRVLFRLYRRVEDAGKLKTFLAGPGETKLPLEIQKHNANAVVTAAVDGVIATREMILVGGGGGILPRFLGDNDERLIACSDDLGSDKYHLFIGCLPAQKYHHRIEVVMTYLSKQIAAALGKFRD